MSSLFWRLVAAIVSHPAVADRLIKRAARTPYSHIRSQDGSETYMRRWWLFNPYGAGHHSWLPSIRIHHIRRPDRDRHCHDHPWDARTFLLRGWYTEKRLKFFSDTYMPVEVPFWRDQGDTATLKVGEYHRIDRVAPAGAWTLFITWKYQGVWGFNVDGIKIPHHQYQQPSDHVARALK